jgi:putative membrane protein
MKTYLLLCKILLGLLLVNACSNTSLPETIARKIRHKEATTQNIKGKENDAQFLVDAVEINMMERQLSELAQKKANSSRVQALGRQLEVDHFESYKRIIAIAKQKLVTLPTITTNEARRTYDNLNEKLNTQFDKAYCSRMISDHKNAIALFEKAKVTIQDPEIKAWVMVMLPVLRSNLDYALHCKKNFDM